MLCPLGLSYRLGTGHADIVNLRRYAMGVRKNQMSFRQRRRDHYLCMAQLSSTHECRCPS